MPTVLDATSVLCNAVNILLTYLLTYLLYTHDGSCI